MSAKYSDPNYDLVWDMLNGTCVLCYQSANSIHEIKPRSSIPNDWMDIDNRVTLCHACHQKVQDTPKEWEARLIQARNYMLDVLGE